jgi:hypothetical protein
MVSKASMSERRRGERVLLRVPVKIYALDHDNQHFNETAETAVVSRSGALLRTSVPLKQGSQMEVMNNFTQDTEQFRVVWVADKPKEGKFDIGVELLSPRDDFWGIRFPPRNRK